MTIFNYEHVSNQAGENFVILRSSIGIATYSNTVTFHEAIDNSGLQNKSIDLDDIKYFSMDIVNIVKNTDMYRLKQEEASHCGYFSVKLNGNNKTWHINYYKGHDADLLFSAEVDSITGEVTEILDASSANK